MDLADFAFVVVQEVGRGEGLTGLDGDAAADGSHERVAAPEDVDHAIDLLRCGEGLDAVGAFVAEDGHGPAGLAVVILGLDESGGDGQVDAVAKLRVDRRDRGEFRVAFGEGFGEGAAGTVDGAGCGATAVGSDDFVGVDQFDAVADEFHCQIVGGFFHALIIGNEIPALQCVAADGAGINAIDPADELADWRVFETDADEFHAVIGFDQDLSEMGVGGDATDVNILRAEVFFQAGDDVLRIFSGVSGGELRANIVKELLHFLQAFRRGID